MYIDYDYDAFLVDEEDAHYPKLTYEELENYVREYRDRSEKYSKEIEALKIMLAAWERTVPSKEQEVEKYINEFIQQRAQIASSREATPPTQ